MRDRTLNLKLFNVCFFIQSTTNKDESQWKEICQTRFTFARTLEIHSYRMHICIFEDFLKFLKYNKTVAAHFNVPTFKTPPHRCDTQVSILLGTFSKSETQLPLTHTCCTEYCTPSQPNHA